MNMPYHLVRLFYLILFLHITNQPKWNRKIKYGNHFLYNYIQTLLQSFQTMGNVNCASETLVEGQANQKIDLFDTNTTFQEDYTHYIDSKQKNVNKDQIIKIRSLGIVKGSKQLQFGFENYPSGQRAKQKIRSLNKSTQKQTDNQSRTHLEPIVFSIIDFSVSSDDSQKMIQENAIDMPSQRFDKFLSSTTEQLDEGINVQKASCNYLLNFVDWTPNVEVNKEQFIRIKKTNIENQYFLKQKMGEGSFGEVYKCIHKATNQVRAVKKLKRNLLINPKIKQQFLQEFSILKKVDHPNILKIFEIYEVKNSVSIVSQFCEGNSLGSYIKTNMKLNPQTKMEILRQIFLGVNYLHHMKIIHRDLKPQNVVFINPLTPQTTPEEVDLRIIDFGLAIEQKEPIFKDWANIGTYNFMAPEVFQGIYSNKCDSWACGVITYLLLVGFNPYRGHEIEEVKKKIKTFSPKISDFNNIDVSAIDLMLNLTKINYVIRWDIVEALNSEYFTKIQTKIDKKDVFWRLSSYKNNNSLVSVIQSYLTFKKMNQNDQSALRKHFNQININKNGTINVEQLHKYFDGVQKQEIQRYFKRIDKNRSGSLDFCQFSAAMSCKKQLFTQQNLRQVFDAIDFNKKGKLTRQQIRYFLRSFDRSSISDLISQISQTNSDFITFQQFSAYLKKDQWL